jgi:SAM-dependent methyltransferase
VKAAQAAVDAALQGPTWRQRPKSASMTAEVHFPDFEDFEQRMMRPTFADHRIDEAKLERVRSAPSCRTWVPDARTSYGPCTCGCCSARPVELPAAALAADKPFSHPAATWNQRFANADGYLFGTEPNAWLREHGTVWKAGQRVLCVADGEGRNSTWLAQRGVVVDAFDIAELGVAKARQLAAERGVQVNFQVADCDAFAWPEAAYDGVAAIFVQFADPAQRRRLFAQMRRSLRPGGTLLLQGYTHRQLAFKTGGPGQLSHLYTEALLREELAGMQILTLREYDAEVDEGRGHRGLSALIGLVARQP